MAYTPKQWKDRVVEKPRTFTIQNNPDGTITLIPTPGTVTEEGTPVTSYNMNHIETGIDDAHAQMAELTPLRVNTNKELEFNDGEEWKPAYFEFIPPDDTSGSPGNNMLVAGNKQAGYFGEVSSSELITGDALASLVGISAGTSQHSTAGWLKFAYENKIQFVAKKTFRHSISWDNINSANCVFGDKTVQIGGHTYKVRLMKGVNDDPSAGYNGNYCHNSEWNKLILPIHVNAPSNWAYPDNVVSPTEDWNINFTDEDLLTHSDYGNGSNSWCQETYSSYRVGRGYSGVSYSGSGTPSDTYSPSGWRPVLELAE